MGRGRPTKLTDEIQAAIVKSLEIGATRRDAAESVGVDYRSLLNWYQAGERRKSGRFFQFFQAVARAEAQARLKYTSVIAKAAADGDWRAAEAFLKRRDRANWGDNVDVTGDNRPLRVQVHWRTFGEPERKEGDGAAEQ